MEGALAAVEATFERIQQDHRHGDVSLLALEPITHRSPSKWAMGFVGNSLEDERRFAQVLIDSVLMAGLACIWKTGHVAMVVRMIAFRGILGLGLFTAMLGYLASGL